MSKDITYRQVKQTAEHILMTGERVTIDKVCELLGNIGSRHQITTHLHQWRKETETNGENTKEAAIEMLHELSHANPEVAKSIENLVEKRTQELKKSLSLVRATLESTADAMVMLDRQGHFVDWNEKFVVLGQFPKELIERGEEEATIGWILQQIDKPEELVGLLQRLANNPDEQGNMGEVHFKDGRVFERYSQPHRVDGEMVGRVWSFHNVTEQRKAENDLRLRHRAIEASTHGVIIVENSALQEIIYANPAFTRITEYPVSEAIGKSIYFLLGKEPDQLAVNTIKLSIKEMAENKIILKSYRKSGILFWNEMNIAPVPNEEGIVTHFAIIINDITERKAMEEQLSHQATHDTLTGLPNRALLADRINQALIYTKRAKTSAAILFLDLDRFKNVNDGLGHTMGDYLLCEVAKRLKHCLRETDTVARIGGDEFVIVLSPINHDDESITFAQRILSAIRKPFQIEERELNITTSIGIARCPQDGHDPETIIRHADIAMYNAKDLGRDIFQFFTKEMNKQVSHRLSIENDLRRAIRDNEFNLLYQPITSLQTGKIVAVEALIRWQHPEKGTISPVEFIPIAEETGLILPIGENVLEIACTQNKAWQKMGLPPIQMSVNVSIRQLQQTDITKLVKKILDNTGLDPAFLVLELTESILMDHTDIMLNKLNKLKTLGIILAIDDFGTGYSSLSYLKQLPVDKIKIDQTFIRDILTEADDMAITLAIIAMAKSLKLTVVAEGAQSLKVMEFLRHHQCDQAQGYYFSKPIDGNTCEHLIRENYGKMA